MKFAFSFVNTVFICLPELFNHISKRVNIEFGKQIKLHLDQHTYVAHSRVFE